MPKVSLSLQELYKKLCPKCRKEMIRLAQEKLSEDAIKQALEGRGGEESE